MKVDELIDTTDRLRAKIKDNLACMRELQLETSRMQNELRKLARELARKKMGRADSKTIRGAASGIDARLDELQNEIIALKAQIGKEKGQRKAELEARLKHALTSYVAGQKLSEHFRNFSALRQRRR